VRDKIKKTLSWTGKGKTIFFSPFRRLVSFFQLTSIYTTILKKGCSDKLISEPVDQNEPHLKERGKKGPPLWAKGNHGFPPEPREKKYKKLLQFSPLRQKRAIFFVYNNNIRLCPASLLNKGFSVTQGRFDTKMLI
jgi:hypothetical protein